jgi:hypothetical protein
MNILAILFGIICSMLFTPRVNCDTQKMVVLIPPFENHSSTKSSISYEVATNRHPYNHKRHFTIDRYSEAPRGLVEDVLVNIGAEVVERQRVDQLLLETEAANGFVNTENAIKLGKMLGANTIIMGTILSIQSRKNTFSGYGIKTTGTTVVCSTRIRVIDIESGVVVFSKIYSGQATFQNSEYSSNNDSDSAYTVIEDSIKMMAEDADFLKLFDKGVL